MNDAPLSPKVFPTRVRWLIFTLACAASWLLYLHRYSWGVIKGDLQSEYGINDEEIGWLDGAFMATYAVGQVPGGLAGDYFGARGVLTAIMLLWSAAVAGVCWTGGFAGLYGIRSAFGLAQAGAYPVLSKVTRNWFPASIRTSLQGIMTAMGRVGAACCPLIIATFLMGMLGLSWQGSLYVIAVPGVLVAVAFWLAVRNSPAEHPQCNQAEQALIDAGTTSGTGGNTAGFQWNRASLDNLYMMLVYAFASTFQDQLYVNWIPSFLREGRGLDKETMGLFAPLPLVGGAVGGIVGGMLNDYLIRRTGNRRWARSSIGFTGKMVAGCLIACSVQMDDGRLAMVVLMAARCFGDWSLATQWGTITDMAGRASGTVFGLVNAVGAVGAFAAGPAMGYLKYYYGWEGIFYGAAAMCVVSALTWLGIDCTRRLVAD
jgi:MFS transporter, ACS family, glucarate transporter